MVPKSSPLRRRLSKPCPPFGGKSAFGLPTASTPHPTPLFTPNRASSPSNHSSISSKPNTPSALQAPIPFATLPQHASPQTHPFTGHLRPPHAHHTLKTGKEITSPRNVS